MAYSHCRPTVHSAKRINAKAELNVLDVLVGDRQVRASASRECMQRPPSQPFGLPPSVLVEG